MFLRYFIRRLLYVIPMLLVVTLVVFSLILLIPGDPVVALLGENATAEKVAQLRAELGLDQPILVQYGQWLLKAAQGDLGKSIFTQEVVAETVLERLGVTFQLVTLAVVISFVLGVCFAVASIWRPGSWLDYLARFIGTFGTAVPNFWLAMLLVLLFSVKLDILPATGFVSIHESPLGFLQSVLLPALALGAFGTAQITRQFRSALLEVLDADYIRTAFAKGLGRLAVIWRHGFRNAMLPVVTTVGLLFGNLLGATVVIETVFSIPGLGQLAVNAILQRDFTMLQGVVLVMVTMVLLINLVTDLIYAWLDPRIEFD
ncbi:MAG: peptide ABC transporter [Bacillus thermozeamaize]|uniref:Peptide ABC transporter n=1 Tax=Bacillus thermozeamaize TaxID=230954 RepID=A0A1Y3PSQ6_9BACI|nr:MAG: peptide ABC transporter [Bacillus thermozeamaize]